MTMVTKADCRLTAEEEVKMLDKQCRPIYVALQKYVDLGDEHHTRFPMLWGHVPPGRIRTLQRHIDDLEILRNAQREVSHHTNQITNNGLAKIIDIAKADLRSEIGWNIMMATLHIRQLHNYDCYDENEEID